MVADFDGGAQFAARIRQAVGLIVDEDLCVSLEHLRQTGFGRMLAGHWPQDGDGFGRFVGGQALRDLPFHPPLQVAQRGVGGAESEPGLDVGQCLFRVAGGVGSLRRG